MNSVSIQQKKKKLLKSGKMNLFHWLVVLGSLIITLFAWSLSKSQIEEKAQANFTNQTNHIIELIKERLQKYEDVLWAGVSFSTVRDGMVSYDEWKKFAEQLKIEAKYPGINGIGVIHRIKAKNLADYLQEQRLQRPDFIIHPKRVHPHNYFPVTYIIPETENEQSIGLDIAFEKNRYDGIISAIDKGEAVITGPIVLVQDKEQTPGFLFYTPFYYKRNPSDVIEREETALGAVFSPFITKKLMLGLLSEEVRHVKIKISDQNEVIYNELDPKSIDFDSNPLFKRKIAVPVYGRIWEVEFWSSKSFKILVANNQPLLILIGGLIIDLLLLVLFIILSRANKQAINFAEEMNAELNLRTIELEKSNKDIEQLSYLAAHDLKTPLRGIHSLIEIMIEDISEEDDKEKVLAIINENLSLITTQVELSSRLLDDLLGYTTMVNKKNERAEWFDPMELIDNIFTRHALQIKNHHIETQVRQLFLPKILIESVFNNLISNAIKYGRNQSGELILDISISQIDREYTFTVRDYGPGVPEGKEEYIFQIFKTLDDKNSSASTGLGLSIVKKIIENAGGDILAKNADDQNGLIISFSWPIPEA